jgi:outer membrane protein assembly factor BamB
MVGKLESLHRTTETAPACACFVNMVVHRGAACRSAFRGAALLPRIVGLLLLAALASPGGVCAQAANEGAGQDARKLIRARPARPPGDVQRQLERLRLLTQEASWEQFCDLVDELLATADEGWVAVKGDVYESARQAVNRRIASLPAEGLAAYRRHVDRLAVDWLERGVADRNETLLRKIVREAFCSSSGDDALWALGEIELERGDYQAARSCWRRLHTELDGEALLAYPDSSIDLSAVRARLALVSIREGDFRRAEREIAELTKVSPGASGRLGGVESNYVTRLTQLLNEARHEPPAVRWSGDWPAWGGILARGAADAAPFAPSDDFQQSWTVPVNLPEVDGDEPVMAPAGFPVVTDGRVLYQDSSGIYVLPLVAEARQNGTAHELWRAERNAPLAIGPTLTAGGKRLFAVAPFRDPGGSNWATRLMGFDLQREGALLFQQGADQNGSLLANPLATRSGVIVGQFTAGQGQKTSVASYDGWTGDVRWRRSLGWAVFPAAAAKESAVSMAICEGSGIIFAVSSGMIAAFSSEDGEPLWMRLYPLPLSGTGDEGPSSAAAGPDGCIAWRGNLVVGLQDFHEVMCLDSSTGGVKWRAVRPAPAARILSVDDEGVLLTGERLWRLSLLTGEVDAAFGKDLSGGVGRGCAAGEVIFWPTAGEILQVDRKTGTPSPKALALPAIGGANVLVAKADPPNGAVDEEGDYYVVAAGPTHLTAYRRVQGTAGDTSTREHERGADDGR